MAYLRPPEGKGREEVPPRRGLNGGSLPWKPPPAVAGLEASAQPSCPESWRLRRGLGRLEGSPEGVTVYAGVRRASLVRSEKRYAKKKTKGREKDAGKMAARSAVPLSP